MTDIEKKALRMINQIHKERNCPHEIGFANRKVNHMYEALCRAIEQHEAFKQEVSDAVGAYNAMWQGYTPSRDMYNAHFAKFIIAKPDHIRGAALDIGMDWGPDDSDSFRAALAARGLKIVEAEK